MIMSWNSVPSNNPKTLVNILPPLNCYNIMIQFFNIKMLHCDITLEFSVTPESCDYHSVP